MKKVCSILAAVVAVVFVSAGMSSCTKAPDASGDSDSTSGASLVGTNWTATRDAQPGLEVFYLYFDSETKYTLTMAVEDGVIDAGSGTYTRDGNTLTMKSSYGETMTASIGKDTITLQAPDEITLVFTRVL